MYPMVLKTGLFPQDGKTEIVGAIFCQENPKFTQCLS